MENEVRDRLIEEWYYSYSQYLYHYAVQFIDHHSAEEIVQETFRVVCQTEDLPSIRRPKTWLRKIAHLVLLNWQRDRQRWKAMLIDLDSLPDGALGKHIDDVNIELEYDGLLTPEQLHLLNLLASGYTYADAANELNITSAEACRKRAKRAEKLLEAKLRLHATKNNCPLIDCFEH